MTYEKAKVTIELEEYLDLKKLIEDDQMKLVKQVVLAAAYTICKNSYQRMSISDSQAVEQIEQMLSQIDKTGYSIRIPNFSTIDLMTGKIGIKDIIISKKNID